MGFTVQFPSLQKQSTFFIFQNSNLYLTSGPREQMVALTILLLFIELSLREVHVKGDDEGTADVDVVKVWQALSFLPHSGPRLCDLISQYVDLFDSGHMKVTHCAGILSRRLTL